MPDPDAVYRALKVRAAQHNRSTEAEVRANLEAAARSEARLRLGTALAEMSRKIGVTNADGEALNRSRDNRPARAYRPGLTLLEWAGNFAANEFAVALRDVDALAAAGRAAIDLWSAAG